MVNQWSCLLLVDLKTVADHLFVVICSTPAQQSFNQNSVSNLQQTPLLEQPQVLPHHQSSHQHNKNNLSQVALNVFTKACEEEEAACR